MSAPSAKMPHLSYIGDADVGERTNLGAARSPPTTTAHDKHRTTIGADVRTGVDTTFVAPVTVGDGAVIGAGSVITEDVPAGRARRSPGSASATSRVTRTERSRRRRVTERRSPLYTAR